MFAIVSGQKATYDPEDNVTQMYYTHTHTHTHKHTHTPEATSEPRRVGKDSVSRC